MIKVNSHIRRLLMRQAETLMLSQTSCEYLGTVYTFPKMTRDEAEVERLKLLKILNKKSFAQAVFDNLFNRDDKTKDYR